MPNVNDKVEFKVWDWDAVGGDDPLGKVLIGLDEFETGMQYDEW